MTKVTLVFAFAGPDFHKSKEERISLSYGDIT